MSTSTEITTLPTISSLHTLPSQELNSILSTLFEPSAPLASLAQPIIAEQSPEPLYTSYDELIALIGEALRTLAASSDEEELGTLDGILCAHPRLGEKRVDSAMSRMEQAAMNAAASPGGGAQGAGVQGQEEEAQMLRELNAQYEAVFPGLIYTVFVNGRPRTVIMDDMRRRIERGDRQAERTDAIEAMCAIAADRARKLQ